MARQCIGGASIKLENDEIAELKYYIVRHKLVYDGIDEKLFSYGIAIEKIEDSYIESEEIKDITCSEKMIIKIAGIIKDNKVLPIHLKDVILDMLS